MNLTFFKKKRFWMPLAGLGLVAVGLAAGLLFRIYVTVDGEDEDSVIRIVQRNDRLEDLINIIERKYVDSVSVDSLYQDAIAGILMHLDPHSSYIPRAQVKEMQAGLEGKFKGIGISVLMIRDSVFINDIIAGGPAEESGLKVGDCIVAVDSIVLVDKANGDELMRKIVLDEQQNRLKLLVCSPGEGPAHVLHLKKGLVPYVSVRGGFMIGQETGYLKIDRFSATTYREFTGLLSQLVDQKKAKNLVLDLRDNPGGYVEAATKVAEEFLKPGQMIVYTEGKNEPRANYYVRDEGKFTKGRLIVLVDESTTSAAEILSGAIQDWDRGVIIGRRTFGKGLVQEQITLKDGSMLRLTIARYYTPSGRSIQRSYAKGNQAYRESYTYRILHPDSIFAVSGLSIEDSNSYYSLINKRKLYGGGGITPDIIKRESELFSQESMRKVTSHWLFDPIVLDYYIQHYQSFQLNTKPLSFTQTFVVPEVLLAGLKEQSDYFYPEIKPSFWQNPAAMQFLKGKIKAKLLDYRFGGNAGLHFWIRNYDPLIKESERVLANPDFLRAIRRKAA